VHRTETDYQSLRCTGRRTRWLGFRQIRSGWSGSSYELREQLDDTAFGAVTFSWQDPVHSWKAGPGEVNNDFAMYDHLHCPKGKAPFTSNWEKASLVMLSVWIRPNIAANTKNPGVSRNHEKSFYRINSPVEMQSIKSRWGICQVITKSTIMVHSGKLRPRGTDDYELVTITNSGSFAYALVIWLYVNYCQCKE